MEQNIEKLKFPIGKFHKPEFITKELIQNWIKIIAEFPEKIKNETQNLTEVELEKQYRPNGWTIKQIVHHCADSHINSLVRFKLALTEETPTIKPYFENLWAELSDSKNISIQSSLKILEGLHTRWIHLLESLDENDLEKEFFHPESKEKVSLKTNIGMYAWHCEHHLAHIKIAKGNE
ncbi:YfiT family bacillithiol transferase [Moheibacter sediminis]|uniref:DinB superfamily protein n=1 Tax=Moheibacter sediminis TaxID=1434700 RepID=A0A1W2AWZ6_9FLAO|nr:putative metal-dependent hydrolase [Moheibacter sediminis]SMC65245.1 DinB superfamily protein [Moheibacter sediminis]